MDGVPQCGRIEEKKRLTALGEGGERQCKCEPVVEDQSGKAVHQVSVVQQIKKKKKPESKTTQSFSDPGAPAQRSAERGDWTSDPRRSQGRASRSISFIPPSERGGRDESTEHIGNIEEEKKRNEHLKTVNLDPT